MNQKRRLQRLKRSWSRPRIMKIRFVSKERSSKWPPSKALASTSLCKTCSSLMICTSSRWAGSKDCSTLPSILKKKPQTRKRDPKTRIVKAILVLPSVVELLVACLTQTWLRSRSLPRWRNELPNSKPCSEKSCIAMCAWVYLSTTNYSLPSSLVLRFTRKTSLSKKASIDYRICQQEREASLKTLN